MIRQRIGAFLVCGIHRLCSWLSGPAGDRRLGHGTDCGRLRRCRARPDAVENRGVNGTRYLDE
jgi:hypothetical protein